MDILVCVKRVPVTGARIVLTGDARAVNTRNLGFAISPHEECAVEAAVQLLEAHGGTATVLTLGPPEAEKQLRESLAMGIERAILLETGEEAWDPEATARAIVQAVQAERATGIAYDLLLFGNESADSGNYQIGIRVAHALGLPCLTGIKALHMEDGTAIAKREISGGWEVYEVPLPAVFTVKEGLNLPRYPSLKGKMRAKKKEITMLKPERTPGGLEMIRMMRPPEEGSQVKILGEGPAAVPNILEMLKDLGVV